MKNAPKTGNSQEFLTLTLAHTQPRAIYQNSHLSDPTVHGSSGFCSRWADLAVTLWKYLTPDSRVAVCPVTSVFWLVQENCWFSLYSVSSHCKDGSDNAKALYMCGLKPEIPPHLFFIILSVSTECLRPGQAALLPNYTPPGLLSVIDSCCCQFPHIISCSAPSVI